MINEDVSDFVAAKVLNLRGENMAFDFTEEAINEMYNTYKNVLIEIQKETERVVVSIIEKATELKYEPVIKLAEAAIKFYNQDLKAAELKAMSEWQNGDLSCSKVMKKMSAGDCAKARSRKLEQSIESEIQTWRDISDSSLSGIDTHNWKCNASDFNSLKQIIDKYIESLEDKLNRYSRLIDEKKGENEVYESIGPIILQAISIVMTGFRLGVNESFSALSREFDVRTNEIKNSGFSTSQSIKAKSENFVSSGASALKARVKQILE